VDEIMGALRDVIRRWRRRPAFATLAVLMLTVGLAAPTAIFSVVNAVLLLGPPWQSPEQLVLIHGVVPDRRLDPARAVGWDRALLSWPTWEALKDSRAFESVAAWLPALSMTVGHRALELTSAMEVSSNFLPTLGVRLGQGRQFSAADDEGPTDGVIISHEAWRQRFGGEPDVLGRVVVLGWAWAIGSNGASSLSSRTVIGVLPPGYGPGDHLAVVSAEFERRFFAQGAVGQRFMRTYPSRAGIPYMVIGVVPDVRVGPDLHEGQPAFYALDRQISGVTHFIVRTDGGTADVLPAIRSAIGEADSQLMVTSITTMGAALARSPAEESFRGSLAAIFAAAAILLAAMGVYGLTLRATIERRREFGIRVALGASAANVSRQAMRALVPVVTVAAVVGVAAGAAAVQLAHWLVPGMPQLSVILMAIDGAAMAGIALLAALPGALRAGQQAPLIAIRG
jgi:hypothetical protein